MDINLLFENIVKELDLGNLVEDPTQVTGGLTHRMFKISTDKGKYIIKLLNPNIMKRPTALDNFNSVDAIEEILKENNISAIYSLKFNDKKMQKIESQYFYVYDWYDGKALNGEEITKFHCEEMGKLLAKIHNIDLKEKEYIQDKKDIDFKYYIDISKDNNPYIYELLHDKLDVLNESINEGNKVCNLLPNYESICHNDMDPKNVLWLGNDYKLIDLECLGYFNPYIELYELAICWSGYEKCNINYELFKTFLKSYFDNSKLSININWENVYYANNGRLEWLLFNIKRSLMIDCDSKEEQQIGLNEVKETINHVIYYKNAKDDILKAINEIIK